METEPSEIKTMKLYLHPDRIYEELKEFGYDKNSQMDIENVFKYDQWHYEGISAIDDAIKHLGIGQQHRVLDIGSGIGGPSRYLAHKTGCQVIGIEMQKDALDIATDLTARCGISDKVQYKLGDFLEMDLDELGKFDFIVSWLVFLHVKDKDSLFKRCSECLSDKGIIFIEDFYKIKDFTTEETEDLKNAIFCEELPNLSEYEAHMVKAGLSTQITDMTEKWTHFVDERLKNHFSDEVKMKRISVYGEENYKNQGEFYETVNRVFAGKNLGGARLIGNKKC